MVIKRSIKMGLKTITMEHSEERDQLVERILQSASGVFDIFAIYIGERLGFYRALVEHGPLASPELAVVTGTDERYVREWLEQQVVTGILKIEEHQTSSSNPHFYLPSGRAEVLVDQDSLNYLAPLAQIIVGTVGPIKELLQVFKNGGGLPYDSYGDDVIEGQAGMNRAMFLQQLGHEYLPMIGDLHERLLSDPPARVADIGVGAGWSSIGMVQAYPNIQVDGFDLDEASIELANHNLAGAGINGRLNFYLNDAADPSLAGRYDLVTAYEAIHDMSDPIGALNAMRRLAGEDGTVLVMDERVGETLSPDGDEVEALMYGFSVLLCLPAGMAGQPSAGTGTVMRPNILLNYARRAGFREIEILPIDNYFFRFYRLIQ
jgi:ubiquinone/menaquinone biosynthesis C-methylase UbiE